MEWSRHAIVESDQIFTTSGGRVVANKSRDRSIMIVGDRPGDRGGAAEQIDRQPRETGSGKRVHTNRWHTASCIVLFIESVAVTVHSSPRASSPSVQHFLPLFTPRCRVASALQLDSQVETLPDANRFFSGEVLLALRNGVASLEKSFSKEEELLRPFG